MTEIILLETTSSVSYFVVFNQCPWEDLKLTFSGSKEFSSRAERRVGRKGYSVRRPNLRGPNLRTWIRERKRSGDGHKSPVSPEDSL